MTVGAGRGEPWLVVIDMQHVFADPDSPWSTPGFDAVVPVVTGLMRHFAGRTVLTRFVAPAEPAGSWVDYYAQWPFALAPDAERLWGLVPAVAGPGEADAPAGVPVVDAPTMGKWGADLLAATGGSRDLVLAGVSTDCCVLSTALAAADAGAWVQVVADACAGSSPESHRRALDAMDLYAPQVQVVTSDRWLPASR